jgi:hypothetical protein
VSSFRGRADRSASRLNRVWGAFVLEVVPAATPFSLGSAAGKVRARFTVRKTVPREVTVLGFRWRDPQFQPALIFHCFEEAAQFYCRRDWGELRTETEPAIRSLRIVANPKHISSNIE